MNAEQPKVTGGKSTEGAWIIFLALFIITIYYERVLFVDVFDGTTAYIILLGAWLILTILSIYLGRQLSPKYLTLALFVCCSLLSVLWLIFTLQLPLTEPGHANCTTWDCTVLYEKNVYCDSWICQLPGLLILMAVNFGIMPALLLYWRRSMKSDVESQSNSWFVFLLGCLLIIIGLTYYIAYYIVALTTALTWLGMGLLILQKFTNLEDQTVKMQNKTSREPLHIDLGNLFQDLALMAVIAVFGFSMLDYQYVDFTQIWQFGLGTCFAAACIYIIEIITTQKQNLTPNDHLDIYQLITFILIMITIMMGWGIVNSIEPLEDPLGIPHVVIGCFYGFFALQIIEFTRNIHRKQAKYSLKLPVISRPTGDVFTINAIFVLFIGLAVTRIIPRDEWILYIYLIALILAGISFLIALIKVSKKSVPA